jgi:hypothetical protein
MNYVHLELKVCEGCGMLWLRLNKIDGNYCTGCVVRLASFPTSAGKRGGGRPRSERRRPSTATRRNQGCAAARYTTASERGSLSLRGYKAGAR